MPRHFLLFDPRLGNKADPGAGPERLSHPHDPSTPPAKNPRPAARRIWSRLKKLLARFRPGRGKDWPTDREEFFCDATWRGTHDLRDILRLQESDFRMVAGYSHLDARSFYLYAVLDEIQKAGVAIRQWMEFLEDPRDGLRFNPKDQTHRMILESVLDEQDFRQRKLLEILVDLICFRTTNEQDYYRHFMLLQELQHGLTAREDFRYFYDLTSLRLAANIEPEMEWIHQLEEHAIDAAECWYRRERRRVGDNPRPGQLFSSFRARLTVALSEATEAEKLVLGRSYYAYSQTSSRVHFQPLQQRFPNWMEEARSRVSMIGVLAINVLVACQKLLSEIPQGINEDIREVLEESDEIRAMFEESVGKRATQGSFVVAYGEILAEVLETRTSQFGYESYCVRFLEEAPPFGIAEDWLPPQEIQRLYDLNRLAEDVREQLTISGVPRDKIDEEALQMSVRNAVIQSWKAGLREVVLRRLGGRIRIPGTPRSGK